MITDTLPEKKRTEGFGILRVVANLAWMIGPILGGFVANHLYSASFVTDAIVSCIVAFLFFWLIPESKSELQAGTIPESMFETFKGYIQVLRSAAFMAFIFAAILRGMV